jgi:sugar phosphate isomerase/epimerase
MQIHRAALEAMHDLGEQIITFHVGLNPKVPLDHDRVVKNLTHLVEYGNHLGITVCLENLRRGPTSHPATLLDWARQSGAMITLDIGHATSNQYVQRGEFTAHEFVQMVADRLLEAHMYEREEDRHYAPHDMSVLGPIVDALLETRCTWWTIELNAFDDILRTRNLLIEYLQ